MLRKVRIKRLPQAKTGFQVKGSLYNDVPSMGGGADYNAYMGKAEPKVSRYMTAVPRDEANLEAEGGETVFGDINGDGIPEHKIIKGPRHTNGGVPLKLPEDSFIFSDTKSMMIKDCDILKMFNKPCDGKSYTPATLAKQYDLEKYRKILQDPESDKIDKKTAELMIKKYNLKLGALALAQESKKGFPQGIPAVSKPYMEQMGIKPEDILPSKQITDTLAQMDESESQASADTMASPTEEQDEQFGSGAEEAQELNSDRPVAQPEPEVDEEAGMTPQGAAEQGPPNMQELGMAMGGFTMPFHNQSYGMARGGFTSFAFQNGAAVPAQEPQPVMTEPVMTQPQGSPNGKMYQEAMTQYQWLLANPEAWEGDPEMTNPDGSLNLCLDCINVDWNNESDIRDAHKLIEEGYSAGTHQNADAFQQGLHKYELSDPVYGNIKQKEEAPVEAPAVIPTGEVTIQRYGGTPAYAYGGWTAEDIAMFTGGIPEAEYGMAMGANSQNYQGRTKNLNGAVRFFRRGGLPMAQTGVNNQEPVKVNIEGMDKDQIDRAVRLASQKNPGKPIQTVNGTKSQNITFKPVDFSKQSTEGVDMKLFGSSPNSVAAAAQYKLIQDKMADPEIAKALCDKTLESIKNPKSYMSKGREGQPPKQGKTWEQQGHTLPPCDQVVAQFLQHQKRNLAFQGHNVDSRLFNDSGQGFDTPEEIIKRQARNPETGEAIKTAEEAQKAIDYVTSKYGTNVKAVSAKIGIPLEESTTDRALQQATFHGYAHMVDDMKSGKYGEDMQYKLSSFAGDLQRGVADESGMEGLFSTKGVQISPIDDFRTSDKSYYGNTTAGQIAGAGLLEWSAEDIAELDKQKAEAKPCPCKKSDGTKIDVGVNPNTGQCNECVEDKQVDVDKPAEWWLQDTIKSAGAFGDRMGIKKYMPWSPRVDLETPRPTFKDPTRELADNAEQANIQSQAMGQFAGPQGMSSRQSNIQGQASKNAANVLSRYNNDNVNIGNQFEMAVTGIRNQEQMANAGANQKVYDQNTMANQQFDNSKMALRHNALNQYTNAITNRMKTDALNQLYPQYNVRPGVGGKLTFTEGRGLTGQGSGSSKTYDEWFKYYKDQNQSDEDAGNNANRAFNSQGGGGGGDDKQAILNAHFGKKIGGQLKEGGFTYGDITYPFIL